MKTVSEYSNATVTSNATKPVTAIVNGTTFTSPTVYLSYAGVSAIDGCGRAVGRSHLGAVLSLDPNSVSSMDLPHGPTSKFNFADLKKPYPSGVLQQMCFPAPLESCSVDTTSIYQPRLVVPDEIRDLDRSWKSCDPDYLRGSFDPPRILVPAQNLVQPTSVADVKVTTPAATPAFTVSSQRPSSTTRLVDEKFSSTVLSSPTKTNAGNERPAKYSTYKGLPAGDSSDQKPSVKSQLAASSPVYEGTSKHSPGQNHEQAPITISASDSLVEEHFTTNTPAASSSIQESFAQNTLATDPVGLGTTAQDPPTRTEPIQSPPVRNSPNVNPSEHISLAQNMPTTDLPTDSPANHESPNSATTKNSLTNDPPSETQHPASYYVVNSKTPGPGGDLTMSGTSMIVPPARLSAEISLPSLPVIVIESRSFTANSMNQYIISSHSSTPNGQSIVAGTPISAPTIGTPLHDPTPTLALLVIASETSTENYASQYIVNQNSLDIGGHTIISGTFTSLTSEAHALASEGNEGLLSSRSALPSITIGSKIYTAKQASAYIINHQTLTPGARISVDGTPVTLAPQVSTPVADQKTHPLSYAALPALTISSKVNTANPASAHIMKDQSLIPGGQIFVDGTPISLAPQVCDLVDGSSTEDLSCFPLPTLTMNSKVYTANPSSVYVINDQTLTPGGQISVSGKSVSLASQASALVIGSTTEFLLMPFALPSVQVGSEVYTADSASAYVIEGQTLTASGQITVEGTPVVLDSDASEIVIGSSTLKLAAPSLTIGLGQLIIEGFNRGSGRGTGSDDHDGNSTGGKIHSAIATNATSVIGISKSHPTQTAVVFAGGASRRWIRSWTECATVLGTIFAAFH
ncbi:hypothetical protein MMC07_001508 [Pseudocyphellaria aurata]|nr:hypothetical protein [Pseudocyphellaria aurata]